MDLKLENHKFKGKEFLKIGNRTIFANRKIILKQLKKIFF